MSFEITKSDKCEKTVTASDSSIKCLLCSSFFFVNSGHNCSLRKKHDNIYLYACSMDTAVMDA